MSRFAGYFSTASKTTSEIPDKVLQRPWDPKISSAVTHDTMEVSASQKNMTQNKRRKINALSDPAVWFDAWPDGPPPGVAFGVKTSPLYRSMLAPSTISHTKSCCTTFDVVDLSNPQGQGVAAAAAAAATPCRVVCTLLHASLTPALPSSVPTHLVTVGPAHHASASGLSGLHTLACPDCNDSAPVEIVNGGPH